MGLNDVTLKSMLQAVYQLQNIVFDKRRSNLSLLFSSSLICSAVVLQFFFDLVAKAWM